MKKCPNCGKELTDKMINVNMCWECDYIIDEKIAGDESGLVESQREELKKREYAKK